jgi:hypothetical protein
MAVLTIPLHMAVQRAGLGPLAREQLTEEQLETVISDIQFHPAKVGTPCSSARDIAEATGMQHSTNAPQCV